MHPTAFGLDCGDLSAVGFLSSLHRCCEDCHSGKPGCLELQVRGYRLTVCCDAFESINDRRHAFYALLQQLAAAKEDVLQSAAT